MTDILTAMILFTGVVTLLAAIVLVVRRTLVPGGTVSIDVNGQRTLTVAAGDRLLWSLAEADIVLPSACGGRGSCGQCRIKVHGGGPILPTERNHISRREAAAGERLACMVTVHDDLVVEVPPAILAARPWRATLTATRQLTPLLRELTLALPDATPLRYRPGDYVQLEAPPGRIELADIAVPEPFDADWTQLRALAVDIDQPTVRAYSIASHPGEQGIIKLVIRLALPPPSAPEDAPPGKVSSWTFSLAAGAAVDGSGPFGTFHLRETDREKIFVGGGAGIAPMRSMILGLLRDQGSTVRMSFWYGARTLRELCYRDEFEALARQHDNFSYCAALSEPSAEAGSWNGPTGFIHKVLQDRYLADHPAPEEVEYYLCGPPVMARAVATMLEDLGVDRDSILFDDFGTGPAT